MNKYKEVINYLLSSKNLYSIVIIVVTVVMAIYASNKYIIPLWNGADGIKALQDDIATSKDNLAGLEERKRAKELEEKRSKVKFDKVPVVIYKSKTPGLSVESASIDFVSTVLKMINDTDNDLLDISYKVDPLTESDRISLPSTLSVIQLGMTLNGTYTTFQDFVNTLYKYDYVATLKTVKVTPLKENKNILEIDVVLWLYVNR